MAKLVEIQGIGPVAAKKLSKLSKKILLEAVKDVKRRREITASTGISEENILKWVNRVDLIRIKGVGVEYAELLYEVGVNTLKDLADRDPHKLHQALRKQIPGRKRAPSISQIASWIIQAHALAGDISTPAPPPRPK